jgi:PAS domain-containing protein
MGSSKNDILWQMPLLHLRSGGAKKLLGIVGLARRPNETPMACPKPFFVTSDINERKQVQVQILRSNTRLKAILNGISDPLMILGGDFSVKTLNRAAAKYYRVCKPGDVIGGRCY